MHARRGGSWIPGDVRRGTPWWGDLHLFGSAETGTTWAVSFAGMRAFYQAIKFADLYHIKKPSMNLTEWISLAYSFCVPLLLRRKILEIYRGCRAFKSRFGSVSSLCTNEGLQRGKPGGSRPLAMVVYGGLSRMAVEWNRASPMRLAASSMGEASCRS